jgi:DNA-binding CsgD family transcriptional regulator
MTFKYNPFATAYPPGRGPLGKIFRPAFDYRTYLRAGHMALMLPLGVAYFVFFVVTIVTGGVLIWTFVGPVILLATLFISRWLGDLEAFTAGYVNGATIRRPPSRLEGVSNFRSQIKVRLVDPTTWTGIVYLFAQFPVGIAMFIGVVITYSVVGAMTFAPVLALFTDGPIVVANPGAWTITFHTPLSALAITPFGLLGLVLASHVVIAVSALHGWWAKLMLGSRSTRISSRPAPAPAGPTGPTTDGPPRPTTTAEPEVAVPGPDGEADTESEAGTVTAPPPVALPFKTPPAILTPVPNPSEVPPEIVPDTAAIKDLTAREQEVFMLMAHGDTNADIAEELFISEGTVKTHVKRVLSKLYMRDRTQVVVFAYEQRLVIPQAAAGESVQHRSYGG